MSNIDLIYGIWFLMTSEPGPAVVLHVQLFWVKTDKNFTEYIMNVDNL